MIFDYASQKLPNVWGLLFIDCWNWPQHRAFHNCIVDNIKKLNVVSVISTQTGVPQPVSSILLKSRIFNYKTIHLNSVEEFLQQKHVVNNWLVIGAAWRICIHHSPMGLTKTADIPAHQFYIFPKWSVMTETNEYVREHDIQKDIHRWQRVTNECFRFIG